MRSLDDTLGVSSLTWSPVGGRIAYKGRVELRVIDLGTGQQEALAPPFAAIHGIGPVWSPDGETIAYQRCRANPCSGERHDVVLVMPGDISGDTGRPREVVIPSFRTTADGSGWNLYPYRVSWSPDSKYLLYRAWSFAEDPARELALLVAVATDLNAPSVLLADMDGIVAYDGYQDTTFVPIQTWSRQPPD